jgi:hypothetical protein
LIFFVGAIRKRKILPVLMPVLFINTILLLFRQIPRLEDLCTQLSGISLGLGVIWLYSDNFIYGGKIKRFFRAFCILLLFGIISLAAINNEIYSDIISRLVFIISMSIASLLNFIIAARFSRKKFNPWNFILWQLLCSIALFMIIGILVIFFLAISPVPYKMIFVILIMFIFALAGFLLFIFLLPFTVLTFNNSLYKERFIKIFGLGIKKEISSMDYSSLSQIEENNQEDKEF